MSQQLFSHYQQLLTPVAMNILGNAQDAEDMVQETMLKWLSLKHRDEIENPRGYLVRTLINQCLNFLRLRKRKKSGVEIPAELLIAHLPNTVDQQKTLALGVQALMEKLSPLERAVFILKEVFAYSHKEIALLLEISEEYCRQILRRARKHLQAERKRFPAAPEQEIEFYETFLDVCQGGQIDRLLHLLQKEVRISIPQRPAAQMQVQEFGRVMEQIQWQQWSWELVDLGGELSLVAFRNQVPMGTIKLRVYPSFTELLIRGFREFLRDRPLLI